MDSEVAKKGWVGMDEYVRVCEENDGLRRILTEIKNNLEVAIETDERWYHVTMGSIDEALKGR